MKRAFVILVILLPLLVFTNFKTGERCPYEGVIIGMDATRCICCGGWEIRINETVFLTDSIPKGIMEKGSDGCYILPQKVYLDYEKEPSLCNDRIKIRCMTKRY